MKKAICVFCGSSKSVRREFFKLAEKVGNLIGSNQYNLVYGGTTKGMMLKVANAAQAAGAKVIGIIPKQFLYSKVTNSKVDQLIIAKDIRDRKAAMQEHANAFLVLPGGYGTLEEFSEMISQKLLGFHKLPIIILNYQHFYDPIIEQFRAMTAEKFAPQISNDLFWIASSAEEAFETLKTIFNS